MGSLAAWPRVKFVLSGVGILLSLAAVSPSGARASAGISCGDNFSALSPPAPEDAAAFYRANKELASENLRNEIERSGAEQDPQRMQGVAELIKRFNDLKFMDFDKAVERTGLPEEVLSALKAQSKGIIPVRDLLARGDFKGGYALGLTTLDKMKIPTAISRDMGMEDWLPAYTRHDISWQVPGHTDTFMKAITSEDKPIVMFLPPNFLDHSRAGITRDEFEWLLNHPEKMKNVTFVVGAYDLVAMPNASVQVENLRRRSITGTFEDYLDPAIRAYRQRFAPK